MSKSTSNPEAESNHDWDDIVSEIIEEDRELLDALAD